MKNVMLCFVAFFALYFNIFANEVPFQDQDEINATIEEFLTNAERSINEVDFDKALNQLNTALELSKSINHQRYIALSSSLLAQLYYVRQDLDKATTELQRAVAIQRKIDDEIGLAYSYVNYAKIFTSRGDANRAQEYLNLAHTLYDNSSNMEGLGLVALNYAIVALNLEKDSPRALEFLDIAEKNLKKSHNQYENSRLFYYKGRALLAIGEPRGAIIEIKKALEIAQNNGFSSIEMVSNKMLSQIYEHQGEFELALIYLQAGDNIRNDIYNLNKEALTSDASARYGIDAMKSSLNELNLLNAEQERSLKVNKLTTILSVALITILSLLTLSLYKNNNLRARANDLLQKKNSELVTAKENAEKASMAKAQFLSTITHELRTPLYAVTGLTHLLLEESPTPNQKEHLNSLKFSGEYLLSLINNILDLNKLEAKKVEILETSFNLKKRISDVLIALKNSAEDKKVKLHLDFEDGIPKKIKGDPLRISQILINLIGNAIKFTEDGDIWVRVQKSKQNGSLIVLKFEVEDNGVGIGIEKQKAIFENFTQGSLQINRKFGGTGLGLSIVKNLLNLMKSDIHLTSKLNQGSVFYFELEFEALEPEKLAFKKEKAEKPEEIGKNLHSKKILIVEDNKINQMITRKILEKHQAICITADDGSIAIEKAKETQFDLILMDIHMPGISGIEATRKIREFDNQIPIIALTAVTLDENLNDFFNNGITDIIPKPYKTEEFFHKLNKYLASEKARA